MSRDRAGRPVTHATRWLAVRLKSNQLDRRVRRVLNKLQAALAAAPLETVRALAQGHLARLELLVQQAQAALLADGEAGVTKYLIALMNTWRRQAELVALLEQQKPTTDGINCGKCGSSFGALADYTSHGCFAGGNGHTAPPASEDDQQPAESAGCSTDAGEPSV